MDIHEGLCKTTMDLSFLGIVLYKAVDSKLKLKLILFVIAPS